MYDNSLGTITNAPNFDWHLTNLNNYITLSPTNSEPKKLAGVTLTPLGQGSGLLGLPGDFTSPSRFVRATFFSRALEKSTTEHEAVDGAFHILNLFNIPRGVIGDRDKNVDSDYTQWTTACDLYNKRYYWNTYDNSQLYGVSLMEADLMAQKILTIPMSYPKQITILK